MGEPYKGYGWQSDFETFTNSVPRAVRARLQRFVCDASPEQVRAWDESIPALQRECSELTAKDSAARSYTAILEYELPRDFRRPDVIVLQRGSVVVIEFKGTAFRSQASIDQVLGYARDLAAYHSACANVKVIPVLTAKGAPEKPFVRDGVLVVAPESLDGVLESLSVGTLAGVDPALFLVEDAYAPLPSIVQAARSLFHQQPLPFIKRARALTDPALSYISDIAREAARTRSRHLVLLSGVPGSGKTLVGLQLVHAHWLDDLAVSREAGKPLAPAVYLSGNGPLVQVLQHALQEAGGGGRTFVQAIKNYVATYSRPNRVPREHLIVFDEAQRAHDAARVAHVHNTVVGHSEPQHLIEICEHIPEWCVLVALMGEGQAIHVGEEGGADLWAEAIQKCKGRANWTVHGAPQATKKFSNLAVLPRSASVLSLDTEIRFHLTPKVHQFLDGVLERRAPSELRALANELHAGSYRLLVSRDLGLAKQYLCDRYVDAKNARFGLLASSKDKWLADFGVDNTWQTTKRLRVGPWYNDDPKSTGSCCQLTTVATEFSSQGLELDCALVAWGSDLTWDGKDWTMLFSRGTKGLVHDPMALRKNVYRVLLSRGRDGNIVFIAPDTRFDATFEHLLEVGFRNLES